jgi:hypothetical protein
MKTCNYDSSKPTYQVAIFMSRTFSANEQYFSLTTNQRTILLAITFQRSEQGLVEHALLKIPTICWVNPLCSTAGLKSCFPISYVPPLQ